MKKKQQICLCAFILISLIAIMPLINQPAKIDATTQGATTPNFEINDSDDYTAENSYISTLSEAGKDTGSGAGTNIVADYENQVYSLDMRYNLAEEDSASYTGVNSSYPIITNNCENDLDALDGWGVVNTDTNDNVADPKEGSYSYRLIDDTSDGRAQKTFSIPTGSQTIFSGAWLQNGNGAGANHAEVSWIAFVATSGGTTKEVYWCVDPDDDPTTWSDANHLYQEIGNSYDTFYWVGVNVTDQFITGDGGGAFTEFSTVQWAAVAAIQVRLGVSTGEDPNEESRFDAFYISTMICPDFQEDTPPQTVYYATSGFAVKDSTDDTAVETDQINSYSAAGSFDFDSTVYYTKIEVDAFEGSAAAISTVDYVRVTIDKAASDPKYIYFANDVSNSNDSSNVYIELKGDTTQSRNLTKILEDRGWSGFDRITDIRIHLDADSDADNMIVLEELSIFTGTPAQVPSINNVIQSDAGDDPLIINATVTDNIELSTVILVWRHSSDNNVGDAWQSGTNYTLVNSIGDTYTNNSITFTLSGNEAYIQYMIEATDTSGNQRFTNWYAYMFDPGPSITFLDPEDNGRWDYSKHILSVRVTQAIGSATITSVHYKYTYTNDLDQEVYVGYQDMILASGNNTNGIWEVEIDIDEDEFEEDEDYSISVRATNTNDITVTEKIDFIVDSTPESGMVLGTLHAPDEIRCGNWTEEVDFWCTVTFAEAQSLYTRTLSNSAQEKLGDDFDLIVAYYLAMSENVTDVNFYEDDANFKLKIKFSDAQEEDSATKFYIYEKEPQVSNPQVVEIGSDFILYAIDVEVERSWNHVHIGETVFPSDPVQSAWWANYEIQDYEDWKVYADADLKDEMEANVTVWTATTNEYEAHMDIQELSLEIKHTKLYIKGTLKTEEKSYIINLVGVMMGLLVAFTGWVSVSMILPKLPMVGVWLEEGKRKKFIIMGSLIGGISLAVITQFYDFLSGPIFSIQQSLVKLTIGEGTTTTGLIFPVWFTNWVLLFLPSIVVFSFLLGGYILWGGLSPKDTTRLLLATFIGELLLLLLYVKGTMQLAISNLETAELMTLNIVMSMMVAFAIVLCTVFIIKFTKGSEVSMQ